MKLAATWAQSHEHRELIFFELDHLEHSPINFVQLSKFVGAQQGEKKSLLVEQN